MVVDGENKIITNYEHEKIDNGKTYIVKTFKEGIGWFTAEVEKDTERILDLAFDRTDSARMPFWECAEMAVGACVDDGECAFMCGIIWQYCLGSIGLACAYGAL